MNLISEQKHFTFIIPDFEQVIDTVRRELCNRTSTPELITRILKRNKLSCYYARIQDIIDRLNDEEYVMVSLET